MIHRKTSTLQLHKVQGSKLLTGLSVSRQGSKALTFQEAKFGVPPFHDPSCGDPECSKVPARLQARFQEGCSKVPARLQARFQQGSRTVPVFRGVHFRGTTPRPQRLKPNTIAIGKFPSATRKVGKESDVAIGLPQYFGVDSCNSSF